MTLATAPNSLTSLVGSAATPSPGDGTPESGPPERHLRLLNGFQLTADRAVVPLPLSAQRVLALLALSGRPLVRFHVAAVLWPDTPEDNARADLRTALWRLHRPGASIVSTEGSRLGLRPEVTVDLHALLTLGRRLVSEADGADGDVDLTLLQGDLLPDWYDDWVIMERERVRQLRLHALEILCDRLTAAGRFGQAIEAGLAAVATEPLRESAHLLLIKAYLAEGNRYEAVRQYRRHRDMLRDELGVAPSEQVEQLMKGLVVG